MFPTGQVLRVAGVGDQVVASGVDAQQVPARRARSGGWTRNTCRFDAQQMPVRRAIDARSCVKSADLVVQSLFSSPCAFPLLPKRSRLSVVAARTRVASAEAL